MEPTLFVCTNRRLGATGSCAAGGSQELLAGLRAAIAARGLTWAVASSPCLGHCPSGPNIKAAPGGPLLHHCPKEGAVGLVETLLARGWPTHSAPPG